MKTRFYFAIAGALLASAAYSQQTRYYNASPQYTPAPRQYTPAPQQFNYSAANRYATAPGAVVNAPYFDKSYPSQFNRQHYGVDYGTQPGQAVYPSNPGYVVSNNTQQNRDPTQQRVIVQHPGYQAVYGHVTSQLQPGTYVAPGQVIGNTRGGHVHYGENQIVIPKNGWGRGPADATQQQAAQQGWYNPQPSGYSR